MNIVYSLIGMMIALGLLVTIHEFGHFLVARLCGVKVLRFSVGFGNPLCIWRDKHGTEFVLAPIPLGGYVKMLGEATDADISPEDKKFSFAHKNVWQRLAIVLAGPAANLIMASICYASLFIIGIPQIIPVIDTVIENSPAQKAGFTTGDKILAINDATVQDWSAVNLAIFKALGNQPEIRVTTEQNQQQQTKILDLTDLEKNKNVIEDLVTSLGIIPYPDPAKLEPVIGSVEKKSSAEIAGLLPGDLLLEANGIKITGWNQWVTIVHQHPATPLHLTIMRDGTEHQLNLIPAIKQLDNQTIGYIGAGVMLKPIPANMIQTTSYSVLSAWQPAVEKTWSMMIFTLDGLKKLILGTLSIKNIGGPVTIGQIAGQSLAAGFIAFTAFLAYLNVSLAVINLLPIPMLDGGHATFYLTEILLRKPISETAKNLAMKIGFIILTLFMSIALFNDFTRLFT